MSAQDRLVAAVVTLWCNSRMVIVNIFSLYFTELCVDGENIKWVQNFDGKTYFKFTFEKMR
jgi:hypothetical protein